MFRLVQTTLFCVTSVALWYAAYYFPNVPPVLRHIVVVRNRIEIWESNNRQPDDRFLSWFNRDPDRNTPTEPRIVLSPADGFIAAVGTKEDKYHILIEMRYTDVHVQRVPMDGIVAGVEGEGKQLPRGMQVGDYTLDKMLPYQKWTILQTEIGKVVVRQITSLFAKRIEIFLKEGDRATRGQRLGRVLAGSNVVIELPLLVNIKVITGQEVLGGETVIATY